MAQRNSGSGADELKSQLNIVDVVGRVVPLIREFVLFTVKRPRLLLCQIRSRYSPVLAAARQAM